MDVAFNSALSRRRGYYNTNRPHQGYRNMGRRPCETIEAYQNGATCDGKPTPRLARYQNQLIAVLS